jgi:hypothetical protein
MTLVLAFIGGFLVGVFGTVAVTVRLFGDEIAKVGRKPLKDVAE